MSRIDQVIEEFEKKDVEYKNELCISFCEIGSEEATKIIKLLESNPSIRKLDLDHIKFLDGSIVQITEFLKSNKSIIEVSFEDMKFGYEGAVAIADMIKYNNSIKFIYLGSNNIGNEGIRLISEALKINKSIKKINFRENNITDEGVKYLVEALKINTSIDEITLKKNLIGLSGAKEIASLIKTSKTLECIDLSDNRIGGEGVKEIARALKHNKQIDVIDLSNTKSKDAIFEIIAMLKISTSIAFFNYKYNNLSSILEEKLKETIEENLNIVYCDDDPTVNCKIPFKYAKHISDSVGKPNIIPNEGGIFFYTEFLKRKAGIAAVLKYDDELKIPLELKARELIAKIEKEFAYNAHKILGICKALPFKTLPPELNALIFSFLDPQSIAHIAYNHLQESKKLESKVERKINSEVQLFI